MTAPSFSTIEPRWYLALAVAVMGHVALGLLLLLQRAEPSEILPDPIMVIELSSGALPAPPAQNVAPEPQPELQPLPNMVAPKLDIPEVDAPLPPDPVAIPAPRIVPLVTPVGLPQPQAAAAAATQAAAPSTPPRAEQGNGAGSDPQAQEDAADWYALINAHLARNKRYPREARRDGIQGTPTVRFSVNRRGRVSDITISRSSGNAALDEATVSLLRRVSPLPGMPRSMGRETVTISLPIEYSLGRR